MSSSVFSNTCRATVESGRFRGQLADSHDSRHAVTTDGIHRLNAVWLAGHPATKHGSTTETQERAASSTKQRQRGGP
jgi:hypothetical protein